MQQQNTIPATEEKPDLVTKVTSSVSGFVTDQNNNAVTGAEVKAGGVTISTNRYGYFEIKNIQVVKEAATVTVSYPGYFKTVKTYMAAEGKAAFFRIKLLQKTIAGTVTANAGGNVSLSNGLHISFPADAIKDASSGTAYNGTVHVAAQYIDPTSAELNNIMPGDLRGINTDGNMKGLTSFGMMAVELTGDAGQSLQIADGKKTTLTTPIPASISSAAPATIPLWYFDESNGLWKEEGMATKNGNMYVGEVAHFSFWNCDLPNSIVPLNFNVVDSLGNPIPYLNVQIKPTDNPALHIWGTTEESGYVAVNVTPNTQYNLSLSSSLSSFLFTKTFSVGTEALSLGNIVIGGATTAFVHGTVTDCNNTILAGSEVIISNDAGQRVIQNTGPDGSFDFISVGVTNATDISIVAKDPNTSVESPGHSYTITPGSNSIGNIQACGISSDIYLDFRINGRTFVNNPILSSGSSQENVHGPDSIYTNVYWVTSETQNGTVIPNSTGNIYYSFWSFGDTGDPTTQHFVHWIRPFNDILHYSMHAYPLSYFSNNYKEIPVVITEYGPIGGMIAGSFSGRFYEYGLNTISPDLTRPYDVSCNFRIRRN